MAKGGGDMSLADASGADKHQVAGTLEEVGLEEFHDLLAGDFGVEGPVKVGQEFDPLDTGHFHQIFDSSLLTSLILLLEETLEESSLFFREALWGLKKPEMSPQLR